MFLWIRIVIKSNLFVRMRGTYMFYGRVIHTLHINPMLYRRGLGFNKEVVEWNESLKLEKKKIER